MTHRRSLLPLFLAIVLAGCASPRAPLVLDDTIRPDEIDEVVVLPVIDARPSRFEQVQVARNVGDATVRFMRERGYFTLAADRFRERPTGPLDLHVAGPDQLVPLAPEDSKYFMLVQVERLEPGVDQTGEVYDARLAAVLVDRTRGRVVWRDVATASSTLSGVLTVFSRGSRQYEAAVNASKLLVETLPDKSHKAH
ncbi:MAG TPA: hypothetical protein VN634_03125 [Candidatus Limnocylindrales bacterium]|nr:hypothetical protein [Candidatus Limnocylindrales bacterium]